MSSVKTQCSAQCVGEAYDLLAIAKFLNSQDFVYRVYGGEVIHIDQEVLLNSSHKGDIFVYQYGCIVCWGVEPIIEEKIVKMFAQFLTKPLRKPVVDTCTYMVLEDCEKTYVDVESDEIRMCIADKEDPVVKLSLSYGLSQSVKLIVFEESIEKTIEENNQIPLELVKTGKISLSRRALAKKIGKLFMARNFINLHSNILDTPEFFWKNPRYESYYKMSLHFMDIEQRINVLNGRVKVIHELYEILAIELQHAHSSRLEMTIIWLILLEVILVIAKDILKLFN